MTKVSFDNTEVAFKHKSDAELKQAKWLFFIVQSQLDCQVWSWINSVWVKNRFANKAPGEENHLPSVFVGEKPFRSAVIREINCIRVE